MRNRWIGYVFITPWLVGFLGFTLFPFFASVFLSFTSYDIVSSPQWIGLANYHELLANDARFWVSLKNTLIYAVVAVPLCLCVSFGLALLLEPERRSIGIFRTIIFLPSIMPVVATSVLFVWILNPQIGLMNGVLDLVGIRGPAWLQDPHWAMPSMILMSLWGIGGTIVINIAGLKDIPLSLYEAAVIDGAGTLRRIWHITLPMMTPVIFFNLVMGIIYAFQYFTQAYVMTGGGPEDATLFYALYVFQRAWQLLDMGYASAMAWVLFLLIMTVTGLIYRSQRKWVHYGD
jgi:multiple sugar transport system permease protein